MYDPGPSSHLKSISRERIDNARRVRGSKAVARLPADFGINFHIPDATKRCLSTLGGGGSVVKRVYAVSGMLSARWQSSEIAVLVDGEGDRPVCMYSDTPLVRGLHEEWFLRDQDVHRQGCVVEVPGRLAGRRYYIRQYPDERPGKHLARFIRHARSSRKRLPV